MERLEKERQAETRSYKNLMVSDKMTSNKQIAAAEKSVQELEDDFMWSESKNSCFYDVPLPISALKILNHVLKLYTYEICCKIVWYSYDHDVQKYFTCETRSHIDKIVGCRLAYIFDKLILLLPYGFGKQWTSSNICTSQRTWPVDLWAWAHECPVSTRVGYGEIMWRIVTA